MTKRRMQLLALATVVPAVAAAGGAAIRSAGAED
jgi:hypothetical protein